MFALHCGLQTLDRLDVRFRASQYGETGGEATGLHNSVQPNEGPFASVTCQCCCGMLAWFEVGSSFFRMCPPEYTSIKPPIQRKRPYILCLGLPPSAYFDQPHLCKTSQHITMDPTRDTQDHFTNDYEEQSTLRSRIAEQIILKQIKEDYEMVQGHIPFNEREPFNPHGPVHFREIPHLDEITTETSVELDEQFFTTPPPIRLEVGIIGAGMAGLYTAMILQSLNIKYELLEASERAGGRVYTHRFSNQEGDYYDVGAMRFPNIPIMRRTFDLFKRLGINDDLSPQPAQGTLIPYFLTGPRTPLLYNNVRHIPQPDERPADIFRDGQTYGGMVPDK